MVGSFRVPYLAVFLLFSPAVPSRSSIRASTLIGCSTRREVDISICHLHVSHSVTTHSASVCSIVLKSGAPMPCEAA